MIAYQDIYEALSKEKYSEQLQPLPKSFIKDVSNYFAEKKQLSLKDDDLFSDAIIKTKKQLENAVSIFRELMLRRKKKILSLAFLAAETGISKQDYENMFSFEKILFERIVQAIKDSDKDFNIILSGEENLESKNKIISFVQDVEEFIGLDGNMLGPFEKGQIANLPAEISKILVDDGKAEWVGE